MSLGWFERVDVYLGTNLVLAQRRGGPLCKLEPPSTLPMADVLRWLDTSLDRANAKPWWLRVHLSAAICVPTTFSVPEGVQHPKEMLVLARTSAAQTWDLQPIEADNLVSCLSLDQIGFAASMLNGNYQLITDWAASYKGHLISLEPLWTLATQARVCRAKTVNAVAVLEPDALTLLQVDEDGALAGRSLLGRHSASEAWKLLRREGLLAAASKAGLLMAFNSDAAKMPLKNGPMVWRHHWGVQA